jgi:hypothetical protein
MVLKRNFGFSVLALIFLTEHHAWVLFYMYKSSQKFEGVSKAVLVVRFFQFLNLWLQCFRN